MKRAHDESDDDSGENLMENIASDYVAIPELDKYDDSLLDNRLFKNMDVTTRREAEAISRAEIFFCLTLESTA